VLEHDPANWHAAFQIAWIEAAFAPIGVERVEALQRYTMPVEAADELVQLLHRAREGAEAPLLEGGIDAWDIDVLKAAADGKNHDWWEERAARAANALQYGLAQACYDEAEALAPELYFDPPRGYRSLPVPRTHTEAVRTMRTQ
jgi:hypothetical protein